MERTTVKKHVKRIQKRQEIRMGAGEMVVAICALSHAILCLLHLLCLYAATAPFNCGTHEDLTPSDPFPHQEGMYTIDSSHTAIRIRKETVILLCPAMLMALSSLLITSFLFTHSNLGPLVPILGRDTLSCSARSFAR